MPSAPDRTRWPASKVVPWLLPLPSASSPQGSPGRCEQSRTAVRRRWEALRAHLARDVSGAHRDVVSGAKRVGHAVDADRKLSPITSRIGTCWMCHRWNVSSGTVCDVVGDVDLDLPLRLPGAAAPAAPAAARR